MATTVRSIIERAQDHLQDKDAARWPLTALLRNFNQAALLLAVKRPDTAQVNEAVALVAGHRQALPAGGLTLMDVTHNATSKRPVRRADTALVDLVDPGWRAKTPLAGEVVHFFYDLREPKAFEVYPPVAGGTQVVMNYSKAPTRVPETAAALADITANSPFADEWADALLYATLFYSYCPDMEIAANATLAASYLQLFKTEIGEQLDSAAQAAAKG